MDAVILDNYRHLFKDEAAYQEFVAQFEGELDFDLKVILSDHRILGATLSPTGAKELISERVIRHVSQYPEMLDELTRRIEDDEIVD
ncbi:MAG: hypothetical protein KDA58_15285 [Planctomycetaceae bacterium]|nr:hypothetical protein [Planctomycetaceae bacterium]